MTIAGAVTVLCFVTVAGAVAAVCYGTITGAVAALCYAMGLLQELLLQFVL